jgi:hypothetical protein
VPKLPFGRSNLTRHENLQAASTEFRRRNMSRGMPSMTALLGLLAVAGCQNRVKLGMYSFNGPPVT